MEKKYSSIQIEKDRCTGCGYCQVSCPEDAIQLQIGERIWPQIDTQRCIACGDCLYICPNNVFSAPGHRAQPVTLQSHYDAVVIGAGIGGLMTAAGLAKAGKRVLVLEQMSFVGGKYTHLDYKGYAISTAAWTCPGPNSRIGKLCRKLGAQIDWVTIHDMAKESQGDHWVVTRDGQRFTSLNEAQEYFVGGSQEIYKVHRWVADMYNPRTHYPDDMTARQYIHKFISSNGAYDAYVQTIITYCFASQTVDTFSAMETKRAIVDSIEQMADWGTAHGGTAAIVEALKQVVLQNGGEIALRTGVAHIDVHNGKAGGVTLVDGRMIKADIVVHNAGLNRLLKLVGEQNLPQEYVNRLHAAVPANVAALILGTNKPLLGDDHSLLHTIGWDPTLNCYAPTFFDPGLAPLGRHALDVFWVMKQPDHFKAELERVLAQLREIFPDFDDAVEVRIPMFFTGSWTAEMAHRIGQSGLDRLDPLTPVENLYMVGYDCIGYGMAGDIIPHGVQRALYLILNDPQYAPEDEKFSSKLNKWVKAQALKGMALASRIRN
jgi:phytoene dehydrogenase-like protein/NAD-dependent dihydropyrimidine dehydrogenase PreA subunit